LSTRGRERAGLFAAGIALGLLVCLLAVYLYYRAVINFQLAERVFRTVSLPQAARVERIEGDSIAVIALRDVVLHGRAGDTLVAAPRVRLRLHLSTLSGTGPTVVSDVRLVDPYVNVVQSPDGELNLSQAMAVTAGGEEVAPPQKEGGGVLLRDVRIEGGRVRLATPYVPDSLPIPESERPEIRLARRGGTTMRVRTVQGLDARLPVIRFGTPNGWRVEVASLTARLTDPDTRLLALRGVAEEAPGNAARFRLTELRTERSSLDAAGTVSFGGPTLRYDVTATAHPLDFADLQWFVPSLPSEGQVTGTFAAATRTAERIEVRGNGVVVTAYDSRITGSFAALVGGDAPAEFRDTRLSLEPLRISTLRRLGFGAELPYDGEIRGVLSSTGGTAAGGLLEVDLAAHFTPDSLDVPASTVAIQGPVRVGGEEMVRFEGTRVSLQPLYLAALRPLAPEQADRLRGVLHGTATLGGTRQSLRVTGGELAYEVGDAAPTRLTGIDLALGLDPLRFDLDARVDPLSFATLKELFPALPFRAASFAGPIHAEGTPDEVRLRADLSGAAGSIALRGTVQPGTPLRFDLSGQLSGFTARAVLTQQVPVEGPLTGSFAASGSTEDLRFDVDLTQGTGRFALQGHLRSQGELSPVFEVSGDVTDFNLGLLVGRPGLFPGPMTGPITVTGGGREPYRFAVNLTGPGGAFDVSGFYAAGATPSYSLSGRVVGLDVQQLPGGQSVPASDLTGTIRLNGSGTTLETLAGELRLDASGSALGGMRVDRLLASLAVRDGVLVVDTLAADLPNAALLTAEGTLGLTRPAPGRLDYRIVARDLSRLVPLLPGVDAAAPPKVTGAFVAQGWVAGSVRSPQLTAAFSGQRLGYNEWRAGRLQFDTRLDLSRGLAGLSGDLTLEGEALALPGALAFDSLRVAADGTRQRAAVRMAAYRNDRSSLSVAGLVQMEGSNLRGVVMDSLLLRAGDTRWQLAHRAEIRWGGVDGVLVDSLELRRTGDQSGSILVDGVVPPTGNAALQVAVRNLDLDVLQQTLPTAPAVAGAVDLDVVMEGPVSDPEMSLQGRGTGIRYQGIVTDSLLLTARCRGQRMVANAAAWTAGQRLAAVDASIPMHMSIANGIPGFELNRTGPLTAHLVTDSLSLALLTSAVPAVTDASGVMTADVVVGGSIEQPTVQGWAMLVDGAVAAADYGVRYDRINGQLTLEDNLVRVDSLQLYNAGPAIINGTIRLADLDHPELYLTGTFRGFRPVDSRDIADVTISGTVALSGRYPAPVLSGEVTVEQGTIYIPNTGETVALELSGADIGQIGQDTVLTSAAGPGPLAMVDIDNLSVRVGEGVWVQSEDARVEIGGGPLVILKRGEMPQIYGTLQAVRGTYALTIGPLVRDFDVVGGSVRFFGTPDFNPELDITAQHEVRAAGAAGTPTLDVIVHVTGTLEYPRIALTSNTRPPLPESELLNYLVFGQPTFQSALQQTSAGAGGFAQQLLFQEFLGGIITQELGHIGLPCEYFRLRGQLVSPALSTNPFNAFGSTSVECGVQLATNLFLTLETGPLLGANAGLTSQLGMSLDWQVNPHVTARLAREPVTTSLRWMTLNPVELDYQWLLDLRGTWEFGHPRNQAPMDTGSPEPGLPGTPVPVPEEK
jgi:hypothetical protein